MRLSDRLIDPSSYGEYNFSNIPGTIISALTPETPGRMLPQDALSGLHSKYDKVVVFLMDAFGWSYFEEARKKSDFLNGLCERGRVSKMATQFPSTTACNITTMNTAQTVAEHGIFEWFYYEPEVGEIIAPLLYSYGRHARERDTLKADKNLSPAAIYPGRSIYKKLLGHGVTSYSFQSRDYAISPYSDVAMEGARRYGYITLSDGLINLAHAVIDRPKKAYYYLYFDRIDSISHAYGTNSKELKAEVEAFLLSLEKIFWDNVEGRVENVLFILTADHGQTAINPEKCVYLNLAFPEIINYMKTSKSGELLVPAGSCRDMFLYIKDEWLDEVLQFLREKLRDKAIVLGTRDLVEMGYFGQKYVSEALAGRLGDLVILPFEGECVWWYEKGLFEVSFLGHHGGLTKQEMEIPFLAWEL
jgi:predicted AlkP superfamily pyrophosphatase or phosphodiesterase